jgi:hypothetical protein
MLTRLHAIAATARTENESGCSIIVPGPTVFQPVRLETLGLWFSQRELNCSLCPEGQARLALLVLSVLRRCVVSFGAGLGSRYSPVVVPAHEFFLFANIHASSPHSCRFLGLARVSVLTLDKQIFSVMLHELTGHQ